MELLMILQCKGTCAPVAPLSKGKGGGAPVMHARSDVPGCTSFVRHNDFEMTNLTSRTQTTTLTVCMAATS